MLRAALRSSTAKRGAIFAGCVLIVAWVLASAMPAPGNQNSATENQGAHDRVHVLPVQGHVYMLVGAGANITVQVGGDGVLLVDTGEGQMSDEVVTAIRSISDQPIRYIITTEIDADHSGGNQSIAKAGSTIAGGNVLGDIGESATQGASIIAFQTILDRMSASGSRDSRPQGAWPTDTYATSEKALFINDEAIKIIHPAAAHTDGDSIVFFRRSDVVSTGDVFTMASYPVIDLQRGGSIQGIIDSLNLLLYQITVSGPKQEGGTLIIPGHGRLCDQADLVVYQEMVTIIRDRVQDMIKKGMTVDQVKAAKPTSDYDPLYGTATGPWTTDMFVEAVYKSLSEKPQRDAGRAIKESE